MNTNLDHNCPTRSRQTTDVPKHAFLAAAALTTLAACGGNSLEGDWFFCKDAACVGLEDHGIRIAEDEDFYALRAPGGYPDVGYCAEFLRAGRHHVKNDRVTLYFDDGSAFAAKFRELDGEIMILDTYDGSSAMRRMDLADVPPCTDGGESQSPPPGMRTPPPAREPPPPSGESCLESWCGPQIESCGAGCSALFDCVVSCRGGDVCIEGCIDRSDARSIDQLGSLFECSETYCP